MERVHIKEERKRNMVKKSKQILDNKMLVAQCPHMMNQSALECNSQLSLDHFRRLDEDPTSPNPSSSSSLILPIQNTARAAGRTTGPHRLCSSATPIPTPATRIEISSFG